jgi:hypothetical protein
MLISKSLKKLCRWIFMCPKYMKIPYIILVVVLPNVLSKKQQITQHCQITQDG